MSNENERLKQIRLSLGESQAKFAQRFNLPQTTYAKYEIEGKIIPQSLMQRLAEIGYNIHWLVTGEGEMELIDYKILKKNNFDLDAFSAEDLAELHREINIPILKQRFSAGPGQDWIDEDFETEKLPVSARFLQTYTLKDVFAAIVRGDSMEGAKLYNDDVAIFVRGLINGDGIYAFSVGNDVYIKRLQFNPFTQKVQIISENPKYQTWEVSSEELYILGKVIGWVHKEAR